MNACGLIVEYNPFHHGHLYHMEEARKSTETDCIIAVMSGSFLQRGEPAIIDKFHRAKAALNAGADIVIELPYAYAVQSSALFAEGAIKTLSAMGVSSICFGSESGEIEPFINAYHKLELQKDLYNQKLKTALQQGENFPTASQQAYNSIGIKDIDLFKPNNILGFSYVRAIEQLDLPIIPTTIKRIKNEYHDTDIQHPIASATSIRKEVLEHGFTNKVKAALPQESLDSIKTYFHHTKQLHHWEKYFTLLRYQVMSKDIQELSAVNGMDEGLEYRIKRTVKDADNFQDWLSETKTKRYTQTRLQRAFVHILTNSNKTEVSEFISKPQIPYIRLLGYSPEGRKYLNYHRKNIETPIYTSLNKQNEQMLRLDEKAQQIYYSFMPAALQKTLIRQEFNLPIKKTTDLKY